MKILRHCRRVKEKREKNLTREILHRKRQKVELLLPK